MKDADRSLRVVLLAAAALVAASAFGLGPVLAKMMGLSLPTRIVLSMLALCPIGIVLGMPMPLGLRRFSARYPDSVAYAWGANGVASVFTSVFGTFVALHFGFVTATGVAAVAYIAALLTSIRQ